MPFTKDGHGKYKSPSGRTFTKKQVIAYYASNGFTEGPHNKKTVRDMHGIKDAKRTNRTKGTK